MRLNYILTKIIRYTGYLVHGHKINNNNLLFNEKYTYIFHINLISETSITEATRLLVLTSSLGKLIKGDFFGELTSKKISTTTWVGHNNF